MIRKKDKDIYLFLQYVINLAILIYIKKASNDVEKLLYIFKTINCF